MIKGLYETHLYVENLEKSIEFYAEVLGFTQCRFGAEKRNLTAKNELLLIKNG